MKLKQIPEDFIVKETANLPLGEGKFSYFILRKKQWNTLDAISEISKRLNMRQGNIRFAGLKDKQAVTQQYISIEGGSKDIEKLEIKDIELKYVGQGKERMHTEIMTGNEFVITIRALDEQMKSPPKFIPNYFDDQRFGNNATNHLAGRALVKKDFGEACKLLKLNAKGNEYVNALTKDQDILKLCFNAYQSFLFNEALAEYVKKKKAAAEVGYNAGKLAFADFSSVSNFEMPLIHFDTELEGEIKMIYEAVLKKEGIRQSDFLIRQLPNLIQPSPMRLAFFSPKDFKTISFSDDELNKGKKKQVVSFSLPKGSYATIVIKAMQAISKI